MATRYVELSNSNWPEQTTNPGEMMGFRHWGDGAAGRIESARLAAYNATSLAYQDLLVDNGTGGLVVTTSGAGLTVDSELPTAAALADNTANPTTTAVGTFPHWWDGAAWDRAPGNAADGLLVNLGTNNDVTVTGSVTADTELSAAAALTDNFANPTVPGIGAFGMLWDGAAWDRQPGNSADGTLVNLGTNNDVTVTGTVAVTQSGVWTVQPGNTANTTAWLVKELRSSSGALTTVADNAASTTILASNSARIKAIITNDSSARLYLRFEAAAASTSNYVVSLAQHETWEEFNYTGEIRGIWASDPGDGAARVTEFT